VEDLSKMNKMLVLRMHLDFLWRPFLPFALLPDCSFVPMPNARLPADGLPEPSRYKSWIPSLDALATTFTVPRLVHTGAEDSIPSDSAMLYVRPRLDAPGPAAKER